jgi:DNA-binding Lrp family transcriptional regulator
VFRHLSLILYPPKIESLLILRELPTHFIFMKQKIILDEKDHIIISILRKDSRKSIREIAKETNYRPSTIHQRIQRLIKDNIIENFTLKLNSKLIGENFVVFMFISTENIINENAFNCSEIKEVYGITGEYDLLIKMKFKDVENFNDFILKFREKYKLKKTVTMVATICLKEEL